MADWYYVVNEDRKGPVTRVTLAGMLKVGEIPKDTLVWYEGMKDWTPADFLPELEDLSFQPSPVDENLDPDNLRPYAAARSEEMAFVTYAGFWKRFVAMIVDAIVLTVVMVPITLVLGLGGAMSGSEGVAISANLMLNLISFVLYWAYYAGMESSTMQATLGKRLLGIQVTDLSGERVTFARATGRYFAKIISALIFMIGYIMAAFTEKKQGLHDIIAGTLVVNG